MSDLLVRHFFCAVECHCETRSVEAIAKTKGLINQFNGDKKNED